MGIAGERGGRYGRPMPTPTAEILAHLDELLEPRRFEDYGPNGLQVPGPAEVRTLATGVSASAELFELAARERADLLVVHHGLFWGQSTGAIDAQLKRRLQLLFEADIALAAYHLPLDAHPRLGNNALLARALGAERGEEQPFALHHGEPIGRLARFPGEGLSAQEMIERVRVATGGREPLVFDAGPPRVRSLAIVSGAGTDYLPDAAAAGADALLTGEPAERAMAQARELEVRLIAAGHYATETFGVRALGEHLAERYGLRHVFLEVPNPV
jgi:dinuclear metal center YbgI/SA1388 family protein